MINDTETYTVTLDTDDCADASEWGWLVLGAQAHIDDMGIEYFHVSGRDMLWTRVSGFIVADRLNVIEALTINGDFRLVFTFTPDAKTFTVVRYSHDEPTGASFTVREATDQERNDWL